MAGPLASPSAQSPWNGQVPAKCGIARIATQGQVAHLGMHEARAARLRHERAADAGADGHVHQWSPCRGPRRAATRPVPRRRRRYRAPRARRAPSRSGATQVDARPARLRCVHQVAVVRRVALQLQRTETGDAQRRDGAVPAARAFEEPHAGGERGPGSVGGHARAAPASSRIRLAHSAEELGAAAFDGAAAGTGGSFTRGRIVRYANVCYIRRTRGALRREGRTTDDRPPAGRRQRSAGAPAHLPDVLHLRDDHRRGRQRDPAADRGARSVDDGRRAHSSTRPWAASRWARCCWASWPIASAASSRSSSGLSLYGLASLLVAASGQYAMLVALLCVSGLGISVFKTGALALIGDISSSTTSHTRFMNTVEGFFAVGAIVGPAIVGVLIGAGMSWKWLYGIAALICALLVVMAAVGEVPAAHGAGGARRTSRRCWRCCGPAGAGFLAAGDAVRGHRVRDLRVDAHAAAGIPRAPMRGWRPGRSRCSSCCAQLGRFVGRLAAGSRVAGPRRW